MKPYRQGDVILVPINHVKGQKIRHLILAEGELTGHKHRISEGDAQLYVENTDLHLSVFSEKAALVHEQHSSISVPKGNPKVQIQREYQPLGWR